MRFQQCAVLCFLLLLRSGGAYSQAPVSVIAFGSCSHEDDPDQMWAEVIAQNPALWIWLGDNIYGDSPDMSVLKRKYDIQKGNPGYQELLAKCSVVGTWDDHDYGINDGGKNFAMKEQSKKLALDFLDVPRKSKARKRAGIYDAYEFGQGNRKIKVILLDTRTFRDTLTRSAARGRPYEPNLAGDILGDEQWNWLERQLKSSDAALHIIGSSIQFIANEHRFEKWGNFPLARQRMLDLLVKHQPKNAFFISGDRHIAEISKLPLPGLMYSLYDFTSSGLTHTWDGAREEPNSLRVGQMIIQKNFGVVRVKWNASGPDVDFEIRGKDGLLYQTVPVRFRE